MRLFYLAYPIRQTVSGKLSWSHYTELLAASDNLARSFYEQQCIKENWSVRELKRQKDTALFERVALSRDKEGVLELAKSGQVPATAQDVVKDPYIFEFLRLPEDHAKESDLESRRVERLEQF